MRPSDRYFTLIELLVVVAIIAILASMLLPTLSKASEAARRSACANNQRQVAVALTMYGDDNGDRIPPFQHTGQVGTNWYHYPKHPWQAYNAFSTWRIGADGLPVANNLGIPYRTGHLGFPPMSLFCPSNHDPHHAYHVHPKPWGSAFGSDNFINSAYDYNPHVRGNWPGTHPIYRRLSEFRPERFLLMDTVRLTVHGRGWNATLADGSVRFAGDAQAAVHAEADRFNIMEWWASHEAFMRMLER